MLNSFLVLVSFIWLFKQIKAVLFAVYLWQLKEYHLRRFLAHFQTAKGKEIFLNKILFLKIVLLPFFLLHSQLFIIFLFSLYLFEAFWFIKRILQKKVRVPVLTLKGKVLVGGGFLLHVVFLLFLWGSLWQGFYLLIFDVLSLPILSIFILLFEPLAIFWRKNLLKKAQQKRRKFNNLKVVGITGSYGKTSTKELVAEILSEKFKVLKTSENQNSEVGLARHILEKLNSNYDVFVVEMGAYERGSIKERCKIAQPQIGILTGITQQHLATFGSFENIIKGKYELIESLPPEGLALFNGKNKYCRELYEKTSNVKKVLYGQTSNTPLEENLDAARVVARALGMKDEEIEKAIAKVKTKKEVEVLPRVIQKEGIGGLKILDASYSSNPVGVMTHLDYLKTLSGKKVIVMPCLIELGKAAKDIHKEIGEKIAEVCDLAIITTKEFFKELKGKSDKFYLIENPQEILKKIQGFVAENDVVLLEGRVPLFLINLLIKKD